MIKVFSFIGSMAGEGSKTASYSDKLARKLIEKAEGEGEEISYERITADMIRSDYCRSCLSCFRSGICPLDEQDDMAMLKEKMLQSDILFFGSPVYMGDMSAAAKNVIDRIAYWAHRYELAGKPAAVFATTDSSFGKETAEHAAELLNYTGLVVVHKGYAYREMSLHPNLFLEEDMDPVFEEAAGRLLDAYRSVTSYITGWDEAKFLSRKLIAARAIKKAESEGGDAWSEYYVLRDRGILDAKSYVEYLEK
ncbi:MAG: flavodoxin family protein, partial [Lachnospiraceae bacterium]|nr:flavodoxin family protein [Lachnospiraceae bacterium]